MKSAEVRNVIIIQTIHYTSEKTEGAMKNGQSGDTDHLGTQDAGRRHTKQITQHRKLCKNNQHYEKAV